MPHPGSMIKAKSVLADYIYVVAGILLLVLVSRGGEGSLIAHLIDGLLLSPFKNIRCFSFVKRIYLGIFYCICSLESTH
jgi:hypothetical protein